MPGEVIRFADVRGHERPLALLRAAAARDTLPHALLFAGPDGVGKRRVALALAAWLHCETRGDDACGSCAACRQVAAGTHPDLHVVVVATGKKDIGIDRVRDLKRFTQLRPVRDRVKLAIVDDAHRLTVAAQNGLLKTLEEPPAHSLLILVAHNSDALLPTVRSRCQRLQFGPLADDEVIALLVEHGRDPAAAAELAALADGSPGRALALSPALVGERRAELLHQLAGLGTARYVALVQLANVLSHPENETAAKLEALLAHDRDDAVRRLGADGPPVQAAVRRAALVNDALHALRYGNPNRQLLLEAFLFQLARL